MSENAKRPNLTDESWAEIRHDVFRMYVREDKPLKLVQAIIKERGPAYQFSERQFKSQFKKWGFSTKNMKNPEYEAMYQIYCIRRRDQNKETEFTARKGKEDKIYTIDVIEKHLKRGAAKREEARREVREHGAYELLRRKNVRLRTPGLRPISTSFANAEHGSPASSFSLDSDSFSDGEMSSGSNTGIVPMEQSYLPLSQSQAFIPHHSSSSNHGYYGVGTAMLQSESPFFHDMKQSDIDISSVFASKSAKGSPIDSQPGTVPMRDMSGNLQPESTLAQEWMYNTYISCMLNDERHFDRERQYRSKAKACFRQMLISADAHILTSLIHMTAATGYFGHDEAYRHFLEDCCEVMDGKIGKGPIYATAYRYALATELKQDAEQQLVDADERGDIVEAKKQRLEIQRCVSEIGVLAPALHQGVEDCRNLSGAGSPNELVSLHFWAHYLLTRGMAVEAVEILEGCLHQSDNVLTGSHLLTISTMCNLAGAYYQQGALGRARNTYREAAERCTGAVLGPQSPLRFYLLERLAQLQATNGMYASAEHTYMEVLAGRRRVLGPSHRHTWMTMDDLEKLLGHQGRAAEASALKASLLEDYRQLTNSNARFVIPREAYMRVP